MVFVIYDMMTPTQRKKKKSFSEEFLKWLSGSVSD